MLLYFYFSLFVLFLGGTRGRSFVMLFTFTQSVMVLFYLLYYDNVCPLCRVLFDTNY